MRSDIFVLVVDPIFILFRTQPIYIYFDIKNENTFKLDTPNTKYLLLKKTTLKYMLVFDYENKIKNICYD